MPGFAPNWFHTTSIAPVSLIAMPVVLFVVTGTGTGLAVVMSVWATNPWVKMPFACVAISTAGRAGAVEARAGGITPGWGGGMSPMYAMWGFWSLSRAMDAPRPTSSRKSTVWGTNVVFTGCALGVDEPHAASHSSPRTSATDRTLFDTARHPN